MHRLPPSAAVVYWRGNQDLLRGQLIPLESHRPHESLEPAILYPGGPVQGEQPLSPQVDLPSSLPCELMMIPRLLPRCVRGQVACIIGGILTSKTSTLMRCACSRCVALALPSWLPVWLVTIECRPDTAQRNFRNSSGLPCRKEAVAPGEHRRALCEQQTPSSQMMRRIAAERGRPEGH